MLRGPVGQRSRKSIFRKSFDPRNLNRGQTRIVVDEWVFAARSLPNGAVATIRLKLLKLGSGVSISSRRIHFAIASRCPSQDEFEARLSRTQVGVQLRLTRKMRATLEAARRRVPIHAPLLRQVSLQDSLLQ